jgi:hypothetical protein
VHDTILLGAFDTGAGIFGGTWGEEGIRVWEKAAWGGKKDVWDDTSKGRVNEDELETADEQTSEADRKGGSLAGAGTKRGAKYIEADKGMG